MDLAGLELLLSPRGQSLLAALPPYDETSSLRLGADLRAAGYEPELVAAALTQSRLRARARDKLGEFARGMLFTPDGLEQATRLTLAARHARRFEAAGVHLVHDLGCGLGVDAMAFASLDLRVRAVEADPLTAAAAAVNLRHWPRAEVALGRAEDVALDAAGRGADAAAPGGGPAVGAWLDPARRLPGRTDARGRTRRVFALDAISPSWEFVTDVAARIPATGAKLSPAFPHARIPLDAEAQWTSLDGEVLQCVLWWGPLAHRRGRSAAVIRGGRAHVVTEADTADRPNGRSPVAAAPPVAGSYLYDPDRAVVRAGLIGALTAATGGAELADGVGYVGAQRPVDVPWARRYVVATVLPAAVTPVRAWARAAGVGRVTIKRRGATPDPETFRRGLRLDGRGTEAVLVLTRAATGAVCLVVVPDGAAEAPAVASGGRPAFPVVPRLPRTAG